MKDSGIEWLGEIPEHWEVKRIKHLVKKSKGAIKIGPFGSQLTNAHMVDSGIKVYNQRNVLDNDFEQGEGFISSDKFEQLVAFEIFPDDVLLTTRGTIGRCAVFPKNAQRGVLHPCLVRVQIDDSLMLIDYFTWFVQDSVLFRESIFYESDATTIEVIYSDTLKRVQIPVPPVEEQFKIVQFLNSKAQQIDDLQGDIDKQLTLFQEYRTTLISEVVSGKIDVRNEVLQ